MKRLKLAIARTMRHAGIMTPKRNDAVNSIMVDAVVIIYEKLSICCKYIELGINCEIFSFGLATPIFPGNDNNFVTEEACLQRCERKQPPTPPPQPQPSGEDQLEPFRPEHCMLPSETGPCRALQPKYYYNSRDGVCDVFGYGGCAGNQNRFESAEECESKCGNVQDACGLPAVRGRCQENVTRYYYDGRSDQCLTFEYSGCRGNKNNFYSERDCAAQCQRQPQPNEPPPEKDD